MGYGAEDDGLTEAMDEAAKVFAIGMRQVADVKTRETGDEVNWIRGDNAERLIRAGKPGGRWRWDPIQAFMFDDDWRHPLFGDKRHWYNQGYYGITEDTVEGYIDQATDAFANSIADWIDENYGFDE